MTAARLAERDPDGEVRVAGYHRRVSPARSRVVLADDRMQHCLQLLTAFHFSTGISSMLLLRS